jgi:hypothetical protein
MRITKRWALSGAAAGMLLAGGIYGGTALAQTSSTSASSSPVSPPTPTASQQARAAQAQADYQAFISHLASRLNLSADAVTSALKNAEKDSVADQVKAGKITQAQADQIDQRIDSGQGGFPGFGFGPGPGGPRGFGGPGGQAAVNAAATALNLQPPNLQSQLRSGKTLKDIAAAQNVDLTKVTTAVTNAVKPQLDQDVAAGRLTSQQETDILKQIAAGNLPGGHGPGGPGGRGPRPNGSAAPAPSASASA